MITKISDSGICQIAIDDGSLPERKEPFELLSIELRLQIVPQCEHVIRKLFFAHVECFGRRKIGKGFDDVVSKDLDSDCRAIVQLANRADVERNAWVYVLVPRMWAVSVIAAR